MASEQLEALLARAEAWAEQDPDELTETETRRLLERARAGDESAIAELADSFEGRLAFGTAGLRGRLGPGPARMNRVVVSQTSAGFAAFLLARAAAGETSTPPSVVIGFDGRTNSEVFARDAAEIMAAAGVRVRLLPEPGPTPLIAFAVRHLGVSAGVMITASHNPPRDNGYKVYLGDADDGCQIVSPVDGVIAAHIEEAAALAVRDLERSADYAVENGAVAAAYVARTASSLLAGFPSDGEGRTVGLETPLSVVYTAMHGVGAALAERVFLASGLPRPIPVSEQHEPDGRFPTVDFPNPEEPGALDLAFRTAREAGAELVVAHDPDADRLAIALPDDSSSGGYRRLTGNELGLLLGWRAAERARRAAAELATTAADASGGGSTADASNAPDAPGAGSPRPTLACTIVSSPALRAVARDYGFDYAETLSGFKWVSRVPGLVFGFEEALGYLTHPDVVHDKDGISASADAIAMARECKARGITLRDLLDEASERFGHFASAQIVVRLGSMAAAAELSERIRERPPAAFGSRTVSRASDLLVPGAAEVPANVLRYDLADGARVMVRPSGTEPKLKVYLDTFSGDGSAAERRATAEAALAELETEVRAYLARLEG